MWNNVEFSRVRGARLSGEWADDLTSPRCPAWTWTFQCCLHGPRGQKLMRATLCNSCCLCRRHTPLKTHLSYVYDLPAFAKMSKASSLPLSRSMTRRLCPTHFCVFQVRGCAEYLPGVKSTYHAFVRLPTLTPPQPCTRHLSFVFGH